MPTSKSTLATGWSPWGLPLGGVMRMVQIEGLSLAVAGVVVSLGPGLVERVFSPPEQRGLIQSSHQPSWDSGQLTFLELLL